MACDICGKVGEQLMNLVDAYKTKEIQHVCCDCESALNNQLSKLSSVTYNILKDWLRRFILQRKSDLMK